MSNCKKCQFEDGEHSQDCEDFIENEYQRSKYWNDMVDIIDECFPKGKCKERSEALVMLAKIEMLLQGKKI